MRAAALALAMAADAATAWAGGLKIGVLTDMTGPYSSAAGQGSLVAARLAVEDFGGRVLGGPVEVVSADHQNKPDIGVAVARKWFDLDAVDMVTDLTNSAVAIAVQGVAREKGRVDLVTSTATTALTNEECSPYGVHWTFDSYALSTGTAGTLVGEGAKSWYFVTADYAFGKNLEATATREVVARGGRVLGHVMQPLNTADFASALLQAQASGAQVIGLANSGADTANSVKQAAEFGLLKSHRLAAFLPFITDIHAMGLANAQGLILTTAFYWDRDAPSRAWSARFMQRHGTAPTMIHAGTYSAVLHYLKAVQAAGTKSADAVMKVMREQPVRDPIFSEGHVRIDGQMVHDMYVVQVKAPSESKQPWDYYKILRTIPGERAFAPLSETTCKLVTAAAGR